MVKREGVQWYDSQAAGRDKAEDADGHTAHGARAQAEAVPAISSARVVRTRRQLGRLASVSRWLMRIAGQVTGWRDGPKSQARDSTSLCAFASVRTRLPTEIDQVYKTDGLMGRTHLVARATAREALEGLVLLQRSVQLRL